MPTASPLEALSDPSSRQAALAACSDSDLYIATIACNAEEIYPGSDELRVAHELAEYAFAARSSISKQRIATEALRWVSPEYFLRALAHLSDPGLEKHAVVSDLVKALLAQPHGHDLAEAVCAMVITNRRYHLTDNLVTTHLLLAVLETTNDVAFLREIVDRRSRNAILGPQIHLKATDRLITLHAESLSGD